MPSDEKQNLTLEELADSGQLELENQILSVECSDQDEEILEGAPDLKDSIDIQTESPEKAEPPQEQVTATVIVDPIDLAADSFLDTFS